MYLYYEPMGGFNDILSGIKRVSEYCKIHNRILLVNGMASFYRIDFSNYFHFSEEYKNLIIINTEQIIDICTNPNYKIYPSELQHKIQMSEFLKDNNKIFSKFILDTTKKLYTFENIILDLPEDNVKEDIIIYSNYGGGDGYTIFKEIIFNKNVVDILCERFDRLIQPYLCIHIRNTDHRCDYVTFFGQHEQQIRSFSEIYIATDDVNAIKFYINNGLQVKNFTTFPEKEEYSLHTSSINPHTKFIDMICDLLIISRSHTIMSNSIGGYIILAKAIKDGFWSW